MEIIIRESRGLDGRKKSKRLELTGRPHAFNACHLVRVRHHPQPTYLNGPSSVQTQLYSSVQSKLCSAHVSANSSNKWLTRQRGRPDRSFSCQVAICLCSATCSNKAVNKTLTSVNTLSTEFISMNPTVSTNQPVIVLQFNWMNIFAPLSV